MVTAQQFSELIRLIRSTCGDGSASSSRRVERLEHSGTISIRAGETDSSAPEEQVTLKDISARGFCFLHASELARDTRIVAHLRDDGGSEAAVLCKVVNCRPLADGHYAIGASFVEVFRGRGDEEQPELHEPSDPEDYMVARGNLLD
jgi:hypothetical protein